MTRSYENIKKEITEKGFFSEYLPSCFKLDKKVFKKIPVEKCDLIEPYCFTMSRYNGNDARRSIFIPEIGAYGVVLNYMNEKNIIKELIEFTENNELSFSPILGKNDSIMLHEQAYGGKKTGQVDELSSNYIENIAKKIIKSMGAKKILKLDISNCFESFYIHMIPAILLGAEEAEQEYNKFKNNPEDHTIREVYLKYRKLDEVIRRQNLNRTNGLLVGPLISKIIIEGILTRIDTELKIKGIKFSRYVDDYEVYLFDDDEKMIISIFARVLKRYGFSINNEKTELVNFPYYVSENLEKIFVEHNKSEINNSDLMELFNIYLILENNGTKGAIRYLLKTLEQNPIEPVNICLYKSYLLTIIRNNERSLTKACSLLIDNKEKLILNEKDIDIINQMLERHINLEHDLEVLWLLYLLIETKNIQIEDSIIYKIVGSKNELAHIILLRKELLNHHSIDKICINASSWILNYELYTSEYITEEMFKERLNINKNMNMYKYFKEKNVHFCE